jgi:PAS domain S-box-containing protein
VLKALLEHEGFTVLSAYTGRAALQYAHQHHPSLFFLDQDLPLLDGLELCRILRQESGDPAILILCDHPDEFGKLLAFSAGADEYLPLPFHPQELLARARAVLRHAQRAGGQPSQAVLRSGTLELDEEQRQVRAAGEAISLTGTEYELLACFMRFPRRVFTREQLISQLPVFQRSNPLTRAVDIHVSNLRRKLSRVLGHDAPIEAVRGVGYRLRVTESEAEISLSAAAPSDMLGGQLAQAAFDRTPAPLFVVDGNRTVVLYNGAAEQLCGWPADQVVGQAKCYSLLGCHHSDGTLLCHERCALQAGGLVGNSELTAHYTITVKDGREIPVRAYYSDLSAPGQSSYTLLALDPETGAPQAKKA